VTGEPAAPRAAWPYAEVAVDVPFDRPSRPFVNGRPARDATFHYAVPPELAEQVGAGHVVWVPFGRRRLQGIVVALRQSSPVEGNRDILGLTEPRPTLSAADIALARWLNAYYLAPFFECLRLFLPPGGLGREERYYARTDRPLDAGATALTERQQAVLGLFDHGDRLSAAQVRARAGLAAAAAAAALGALVAHGWLAAAARLVDKRVGPRRERVAVRLVDDPDEVDARLRTLRPQRSADIVAWLRRPDVVLPTIEETCVATGCKRAALERLAEMGLATLAPAGVDDEGKDADDAVPSAVILHPRGIHARAAEHRLRGVEAHVAVLDRLAVAGGTASVREIRDGVPVSPKVLRDLESAGLVALAEHRLWRDPLAGLPLAPQPAPELTEDQARVWPEIARALGHAGWPGAGDAARPRVSYPLRPKVCLLFGVTGSGKTELYLRAIEHVLFQGRQALVLVPEIALTAQQVRRFAGRFPGRVGVWHSDLSDGERTDTWHRARDGLLDVIVGSRSAVFAPLPRLGLIILDEEHADAYKQDRAPRYHARDVALRRAALAGAAVILGSATPSVESFWRAERGEFRRLDLPRRVHRAMAGSGPPPSGARSKAADSVDVGTQADAGLPPVQIVDLRAELRAGNTSIFSRALRAALAETLDQGGQAILYLNRRGSATFVLCRDCGHVVACPRCHVPLTWHKGGAALVCHHCHHRQAPPLLCPVCASARIRYFGAGTERVEQAAREAFPAARTLRWDADTTPGRGAHDEILARFAGGHADILVGTQMIAKGLDLPRVMLVGVVSADTGLNFPDFRSAERAFQLLSQVAGRAGRSAQGGRVIFQTYAPDHPAIVSAARHDYEGFYRRELAFRAANRYPPFGRLVRLLVVASTDRAAREAAAQMAATLTGRIDELGLAETGIIGPAPAFFGRVRGRARWHLLVRSPDPHALLADMAFGPGWRVDVDPVDVL